MASGFTRYVIKRVLTSLPMLFLLVTVVFVVMHVLPGDPILAIMGEKITYEQYMQLREAWGLNVPLHVQYVNYWTKMFQGDLGISVWTRRPVLQEIASAFPVTLELAAAATLVSICIGIPFGIIAAVKRNKMPDFILRFVSLGGFSIPTFWVGMMFQLIVAIYLTGLLPIAGRANPRISIQLITGFYTLDSVLNFNPTALVDAIAHLILPALTNAFFSAALINRIARSNLIEVMDQDFIETARAKGLSEISVMTKHAFKNAMLPIITVSGMNFARQLGGIIVTETVFSMPGMGRLLISAVQNRDFALIEGCVVVFGIAVVAVATLLDIFYAYLDPRIHYK